MNGRFTEFLIDSTGKSPRSLSDSIRRVQVASCGFREFWLQSDRDSALDTSNEAFEHLDHIQNELLRQRDARSKLPNWTTSSLKSALDARVGDLSNNVTRLDQTWFCSLAESSGAMPQGSTLMPLSLNVALNKLKHRATKVFNFALPSTGGHLLYVFVPAGGGQPDTLSEIDVQVFCQACKAAALLV